MSSATITTLCSGLVAIPLIDDQTGELYGWDIHLEIDQTIDLEPVADNMATLTECRAWVASERRAGQRLNRLLGRGKWTPQDLIRPIL